MFFVVQSPIVTDSLQPHGLQHARPPCPSPSTKVYSRLCPLHQWCHPAISHLPMPSSSALSLFQHQGLFHWVIYMHQMTEILELQLQHQSLQWVFSWFALRLSGLISFPSKGLSGVFSSTTVLRPQFFGVFSSFMIQLLQPYMNTGKTIALTIRTFVGRVMSAFQHTISVSHSFPAKKQSSSDFMATVTIHSYLRAQEEEIFHYIHLFPFYLPCTIL